MGTGTDALTRIERHLSTIAGWRREQILERWPSTRGDMAAGDPGRQGDLPRWLRGLPPRRADDVLCALVREAQRGDEVALLAVVVCLGPGIRSLSGRVGVDVDEVVSEVSARLLTYPIDRRSSVAGGVLLDVRNRLYRAGRRQVGWVSLDEDELVHQSTSTDLWSAVPPAQQVVQLVCRAHRQGVVDRHDADLILTTRLAGERVEPVAARLGITASAAYQRRSRAEARLRRVA